MGSSQKQFKYSVAYRIMTRHNLLYFLFCVIRHYVFKLFGIRPPAKLVAIDPVDTYVSLRQRKFITATESTNIDAAFYDKAQYEEITRNNNQLETIWKSRLMYEPTPRGSVIMFYDVYRQGFAYYCDTNSVPYSVLNAAAMKYVGLFLCRDLFFDNERKSPIYDIYYPEENKKTVSEPLNSAQFAKMKNYKLEKDQIVQKSSIKNKFIYLGKISNLGVLQKRQKARANELIATQYDAVFAKPISYKDFKQKSNITCETKHHAIC
jgi:hypothetical protein